MLSKKLLNFTFDSFFGLNAKRLISRYRKIC